MLYVSEWTPKYETEMLCSHVAHAGQKAYKVTIPVCREHVACLPQAIKAALIQEQQAAQKPSWLYLLWHKCFGTRPKQNAHKQGTHERMRKCTAKQAVRLDCGHIAQKNDRIWQGHFYVCQHERYWEIAVLAVCLSLLQRDKAAPQQPTPVKKTDATQPVSPNGSYQPQPNRSA